MLRARSVQSSLIAIVLVLTSTLAVTAVPAAPAPVTAADASAIAIDAYVYAYPLVLMELTRRQMTNAGEGAAPNVIAAPMNQFAHQRTFPDPSVTDVLRPNADALFSSLWFDVGAEPLVIEIPDSGGRYYQLSMFDMWSDVFASPGPRTTGTGAQTYAITAPGWTGMLPDGVERITAPTNAGWILGRIQTNGPTDFDAVHRFQDGFKAIPLSQRGKDYRPPKAPFDATRERRPPSEQLVRLSIESYFTIFTEVTAKNPPHAHDSPILQRMARVGLAPGRPFDLAAASPEIRTAFVGARMPATSLLFDAFKRAGTRVNGWRVTLTPMGTYGTDYLRRMVVAYNGLGATLIEDGLAPTTTADAENKPLDGSGRYTMHFAADQLPPVNAFWSLSMYNDQQFFAENPRRRYTLGSRDPLTKNADGSLDLYLQRTSPGPEKDNNWLPTPAEGRLSLTLRLYWPKPPALDLSWAPPAVTRIDH